MQAEGELYLDDESSFSYKSGNYRRRRFSFDGSKLSCTRIDGGKAFAPDNSVERIVVMGLGKVPTKIVNSDGVGLDADYIVSICLPFIQHCCTNHCRPYPERQRCVGYPQTIGEGGVRLGNHNLILRRRRVELQSDSNKF